MLSCTRPREHPVSYRSALYQELCRVSQINPTEREVLPGYAGFETHVVLPIFVPAQVGG